ncbi:MAG: tRNA (guanosine(37)-N1)-methyltransferase TrmD [Coxiellaceae bacterium]|jgi:tRNA (guanine37-N1)-methyltransferase|nr:tRNA (guanosine(37)-N1)-methyltransferase TrmD [Coxiellaceae bacterium]
MRFDIITLFPEMFSAIDYGVIGRAKGRKLIDLKFWNPRDYAENDYRKVDDSSYGGGPGMVMMVKPLQAAIQAAHKDNNESTTVIYLTPQGKLLKHNLVMELVTKPVLILVSGRYEGIDERLMEIESGIEVSIGDYVLSGGELAAMVIIDAVARQLPGVIGDGGSVMQDSFSQGLLDYPHYTRPGVVDGYKVPEVLLSGDHAAVERFRRKEALGKTWLKRPELLTKIELTAVDRMLLNEFIGDLT